MAELGTAAAWLLAATLAWAGLAKLARPGRTRASFAALAVPAPAAASRAVPAVELATAAALLLAPRVGAPVALALVVAFTGFLARRWRAGHRAGCACFGAAGGPLSARTLARNGLVTAAAAAALAAPGPALPTLPALVAVTAAGIVGAVAVALADVRARTGALLAVGRLLADQGLAAPGEKGTP